MIVLCDVNKDIINAWNQVFADCPEVITFHGQFQDIPGVFAEEFVWKVLVSAGNSFGVMGGGIDLAIAKRFPGVEARVRQRIYNEFNGELNVGNATGLDLIEVEGKRGEGWRALIYTSTMRAPISINGTDNVYLAMYAALCEYKNMCLVGDNMMPSVLIIPGLGGQCGRVPPNSVAAQMRTAYENFKHKKTAFTSIEMWNRNAEVSIAVRGG